MTAEEELFQLRREKSQWQEQLAQRDELIAQMRQQQAVLSEQVQALQDQLKKDSHNSHLPPSSDRFHRQPKSLREPRAERRCTPLRCRTGKHATQSCCKKAIKLTHPK
jgi:transposase